MSANLGLAEKISHDYVAKAPRLDIDEVVAVAYQGLINAALAFDESKGIEGKRASHFGGYARIRINGAILDWQRSEDYLQRTLRSDYKTLQSRGYESGRHYDSKALAGLTGLDVRRVEMVIRAAAADPTSTDAMYEAEAILAHPDIDVESDAVASSIMDSVAATIQSLPLDQQVVLTLHYFQGVEIWKVAEMLNTNVSLVRMKHSEAVASIHEVMIKQVREA